MKFKTKFTTADGSNAAEVKIADGKWVVRVSTSTSLAAHPKDVRRGINAKGQPDMRLRPLTQTVTHFVRVIGVEPNEAEIHVINPRRDREAHDWSNTNELVIIADKPFAVIWMAEDQEYPSQSGYRRNSVTVARQVHKGELSQRFRPIGFVTSPSGFKVDGDSVRVVHLSHVAEHVCMDELEILRVFAQISPSSYYEHNAVVYIDNQPLRIYADAYPKDGDCGGATAWAKESCRWEQFLVYRNGRPGSTHEKSWWQRAPICIPSGWADDIAALAHFGFIPGSQEMPKKAFDLRAERPEPYIVDGLLPVRPIDEIRQLRGTRHTEIKREVFERQVEKICEACNWRPHNDLDDRGNFVYYDEFRSLSLFDGQLTIATCFWTRGGHDKGEYWAGFIAVHGKDVHDPRRDKAPYRLMIWPGEILRQTPEGVIGGFVPEIDGVEPEITATVRKIVDALGCVERA